MISRNLYFCREEEEEFIETIINLDNNTTFIYLHLILYRIYVVKVIYIYMYIICIINYSPSITTPFPLLLNIYAKRMKDLIKILDFTWHAFYS